jgi:hypothetical protein
LAQTPTPKFQRIIYDFAAIGTAHEIANKQRSQRETPSADHLQEQVSSEGFNNIPIHRQELMIDVPLASEFIPLHPGAMPIAGAFIALSQSAQAALVEDVAYALSGYVTDDKVIYPDAVHVTIGYK